MKDKDQIAEEIRRLEAENDALRALNESTRNQIDLFEKMARKVISGQEMSESDHQKIDVLREKVHQDKLRLKKVKWESAKREEKMRKKRD